MSPGVAGHEEALDPHAADFKRLSVMEQRLFVVDRHLRQPVEMIDHAAARLSGEIAIFNLADIERRVLKQAGLSASTAPT